MVFWGFGIVLTWHHLGGLGRTWERCKLMGLGVGCKYLIWEEYSKMGEAIHHE